MVLRSPNTAGPNGTRGTAVDFGYTERNPESGNWLITSGRYTVTLDGPEGRLVTEVGGEHRGEPGDDWTSGGGGGSSGGRKKKGAGKKGRKKKTKLRCGDVAGLSFVSAIWDAMIADSRDLARQHCYNCGGLVAL